MPRRLPPELIDAIISRPELDRHTKVNCCLLSHQHLEIARDNLYQQVEWTCGQLPVNIGDEKEEEEELEWANEYSLTAMKLWATLRSKEHLAKRVKAVHFRADPEYDEFELSGIRTTLEQAAETIVRLAAKVELLDFNTCGGNWQSWPVDHCVRRFGTLRPNIRVWEIEDVVDSETADSLFASHSLRRLACDELPSSFVLGTIPPSVLSLELPRVPTSSAPNLRFLTIPFALLPELRLSLLPSLDGLALDYPSGISLSNKWGEWEQLSAFWKDYSASKSLSVLSFRLGVENSFKKVRDAFLNKVIQAKPQSLRRIFIDDCFGYDQCSIDLLVSMLENKGTGALPQLAFFASYIQKSSKGGSESLKFKLIRELCAACETELILMDIRDD